MISHPTHPTPSHPKINFKEKSPNILRIKKKVLTLHP